MSEFLDAATAAFALLFDVPGDGVNPLWAATVMVTGAIALSIAAIVWPFRLRTSRIRAHDAEADPAVWSARPRTCRAEAPQERRRMILLLKIVLLACVITTVLGLSCAVSRIGWRRIYPPGDPFASPFGDVVHVPPPDLPSADRTRAAVIGSPSGPAAARSWRGERP